MSLLRVQTYVQSLGFDPGPLDGKWGPKTEAAIMAAIDRVAFEPHVVPLDWTPDVGMDRIIVHWTAGASLPSANDRAHYHLLIDGDGNLVRGLPGIAQNSGVLKPGYAAHTLNCNTGSIGIGWIHISSATPRLAAKASIGVR